MLVIVLREGEGLMRSSRIGRVRARLSFEGGMGGKVDCWGRERQGEGRGCRSKMAGLWTFDPLMKHILSRIKIIPNIDQTSTNFF